MGKTKPEESARVDIDRQLSAAGWFVSDSRTAWMDGDAVAITEWVMPNGIKADYLLFYKGKAIAVVEAKKKEFLLDGVYHQAEEYARALSDSVPVWGGGIRFLYEANGLVFMFADRKERHSATRLVFSIHRPETLYGWVCEESTLCDRISALPAIPLSPKLNLRACQKEAIEGLEASFSHSLRRAYMQLATGAGKTYTACTFCYRLLRYAKAKRILFLVDRSNLGTQAKSEFESWSAPESGNKFTEDYIVEQLSSPKMPKSAKVVISTVQRLYSILSGQELSDGADDRSLEEMGTEQENRTVQYNADIPPEYFDFIVIDECHRSIYSSWRSVLEYFDARLIGLTATPSKLTHAFFLENCVAQYSYDQSVMDDVNVGYSIFRIHTRISDNGGVVIADKEFANYRRDQITGLLEPFQLEDDLAYSKEDLNRRVESESQIRTVLQAYRDSIYSELYPQRRTDDEEYNTNYIPKTLIFAQSDFHAALITLIAKEVFGRGDDFCQKITYSVTGVSSQDLIKRFRTDAKFRIAVTVDMVATGTDIKPLEVLLFMRDVQSPIYFDQMVGRGCRRISDNALQSVTPNALSKDYFYLVDAVGVTEHSHSERHPHITNPGISLAVLMEKVYHWRDEVVGDDDIRSLAFRLNNLGMRCLRQGLSKEVEAIRFVLDDEAYSSRDEDGNLLAAAPLEIGLLAMAARLRETPHVTRLYDAFVPSVRERILELQYLRKLVVDDSPDEVTSTGFDLDKAKKLTDAFRLFLADNRDKIKALQLIYRGTRRQEPLLCAHLDELAQAMRLCNGEFRLEHLWRQFHLLDPAKCKEVPQGRRMGMGNLIQLVSFAAKLSGTEYLVPFDLAVEQRFNLWIGRKLKAGVSFTEEQMSLLRRIKNAVANQFATTPAEIRMVDSSLFPQFKSHGLAPYLEELTLALTA